MVNPSSDLLVSPSPITDANGSANSLLNNLLTIGGSAQQQQPSSDDPSRKRKHGDQEEVAFKVHFIPVYFYFMCVISFHVVTIFPCYIHFFMKDIFVLFLLFS
jgi:hypothetical protein